MRMPGFVESTTGDNDVAAAMPYVSRTRALPEEPSKLLLANIDGDAGLPLLGHTLAFVFDTYRLVRRLSDAYGPNHRVMLFGHPVLNIGHPDQVRQVLLDRDKCFSSRLGWNAAIGMLFPGGLMLRDFEEHRMHRRIMQVAFRTEAMNGYLDIMNPIIHQTLARWDHHKEVLGYAALKELTLAIAAEVFLGIDLGSEAEQVNRAFADTVAATVALVKRPLWGSSYRRGIQGRRYLEHYFARLIAQRRGKAGNDMFSQLCNATTDGGESFGDREIVDHIIFLMMAAHDTTTSSMSSILWALAQYPQWQEQLRRETYELGNTNVLAWKHRDELPQSDMVMKEALRMFPPVPVICRRSVIDTQIGDVKVPANTDLQVCSMITHYLPEYWSEPDRFDPARFSPQRAEEQQHAFAYYPFGGGAHACMGAHFARAQIKAVLVQLLRRFRIELRPNYRLDMQAVPVPKPRDGLPLRLTPLFS